MADFCVGREGGAAAPGVRRGAQGEGEGRKDWGCVQLSRDRLGYDGEEQREGGVAGARAERGCAGGGALAESVGRSGVIML